MFTLSEKIQVLNTDSLIKVYDATNTVVTETDDIDGDTDTLSIEGFGKFTLSKITNIKLRRAVPAANEVKDFTVTVPAGLAAGDAVEVIVSLKTNRYQSEVLVQNAIGKGRTVKFSSTIMGSTLTAAAIRTNIVAGYAAFLAQYRKGTPVINVTASGVATDKIRVATTAGYESVSIERVEIRRVQQGVGTQTPFSLVATTITRGTEGLNLGKFLEESIRMATPYNTDPYGINNTDTQVDIRGKYTEVFFTYATVFDEHLNPTAADYGMSGEGVPAEHKFSIYLNEATCLGEDGAIEKLAKIAIERASVLANLTCTVNTVAAMAADPTIERTEVLFIADGSTVDSTDDFIA